MDTYDSLLMILRLGGVLCASVAALVGALSEVKTKDNGQLTSRGRHLVILTFVGAMTAVVGEVVGRIKESRQSAAEAQFRNTLKNENRELQLQIERTLTRIESVELDFVITVPITNRWVQPYVASLTNKLLALTPDSKDDGFKDVTGSEEATHLVKAVTLRSDYHEFPDAEKYFNLAVPWLFISKQARAPETFSDAFLWDAVYQPIPEKAKEIDSHFYIDQQHNQIGQMDIFYAGLPMERDMVRPFKGAIRSITDLTGAQLFLSLGWLGPTITDAWNQTAFKQVILRINGEPYSLTGLKSVQAPPGTGLIVYWCEFPCQASQRVHE